VAALASCVALLVLAPTALAGTASISGIVKSDVAGPGFEHEVPGIEAVAYEAKAPNAYVAKAETSQSGEYKITGLGAGEYVVGFRRSFEHALDFAPQFYPEKEHFGEAAHLGLKEGESLVLGTAKLRQGASISGTVTDADTNQPLAEILVYAISEDGSEDGAIAGTNADGEYTAVGLPSGPTYMAFLSSGEKEELGGPYISQVYNDISVSEPDELEEITAFGGSVTATAPNTTAGVDAALVRKAPFDRAAPAVSGTPAVGQLLSCASGSWTGLATLSYSYRWLRDGAPIAGATASIYAVAAADQGNGLTCEVTATNKVGSASALSNTLPIPVAPQIIAPVVPQLTLSAAKLLDTAGAVRVPISCAGANCTGTIELTEQVSVKLRKGGRTITSKRTLVLGKSSYTLAAGHSATIVIHLSAATAKALAKAVHHQLAAELIASVSGGKEARKSIVLAAASAAKHK
jgi:hypothetical protein